MTLKQFAKAVGAVGGVAVCVLAGTLTTSPGLKAADHDRDRDSDESRIRLGFEIAPVPLHLHGKDRDLVGLGSYIVNGHADCNGCHNPDPATEFTPSGNPYLLRPVFSGRKQFNPATYLSGGMDFGPLVPGSAHIVSRNLTPDRTGLPEGGHTFAEFHQILRTGIDFDRLHPTCPGNTIGPNCVPFPFNGALLQIMPWPIYQDMTDHDIRAIYEYLSAIPCVAGPPAPSPLHNDCP
jgi:hypothetical protein